MRMSEERVHFIAKQIVNELLKTGKIKYDGVSQSLVATLEKPILDDILAEEKLDQEVMDQIARMKERVVPGTSRWEAIFTQIKTDICRRKNLPY